MAATGSPNEPAPTALGTEAPDEAELAERKRALESLMALLRPAVQADGGDLLLVGADLAAGVVEVELSGACSSCAISQATLQAGVERILKDRLPWVREVRGGVEEPVDLGASIAAGRGAYVPRFSA